MTQAEENASGPADSGTVKLTNCFSLDNYSREKLENVRRTLPEAARQLKTAGIGRMLIRYDGCGDAGQIDRICYFGPDGRPVETLGNLELFEDTLSALFFDLLQARPARWERNDGAVGEFEWDLTADTLRHVHSARFTDYDTTEHEGV
jgi:hypothetical protein